MGKVVVRLTPGRAGWYDEASRLHLTISNPEGVLNKGTNITNVKRAIKNDIIRVVAGNIEDENMEFTTAKSKFTKYVGKAKLSVRFGKVIEDAQKEDQVEKPGEEPEKPTEPEEPKEPEEPTEPEEPKEPETPEEPTKPEEKPGEIEPEEEPEEEPEPKPEDDFDPLAATKLQDEISAKINNCRSINGLNDAVSLVEENKEDLERIKAYDVLHTEADNKRVNLIEKMIEKAETEKDIEEINKEIENVKNKVSAKKLTEEVSNIEIEK